MDQVPAAPHVDPPRGFFSVKVDDKGRLKLPTDVWEYLKALGTHKVFITSLDNVTGKIYTIPVWNQNVNLLLSAGQNRQWGKDILTVANMYGQDVEPDVQGRLVLPTELRRSLEMENAQVWLEAFHGFINIYNERTYQERLRKALLNLTEKVEFFEGLGLK